MNIHCRIQKTVALVLKLSFHNGVQGQSEHESSHDYIASYVKMNWHFTVKASFSESSSDVMLLHSGIHIVFFLPAQSLACKALSNGCCYCVCIKNIFSFLLMLFLVKNIILSLSD